MTVELTFSLAQNQCCVLCNPPSLADFERECVRAELRSPSFVDMPSVDICAECIASMYTVIKTGIEASKPIHPAIPIAGGRVRVNVTNVGGAGGKSVFGQDGQPGEPRRPTHTWACSKCGNAFELADSDIRQGNHRYRCTSCEVGK